MRLSVCGVSSTVAYTLWDGFVSLLNNWLKLKMLTFAGHQEKRD